VTASPLRPGRRHLLALLGFAAAIAAWWAVIACFDVKPFIAPSPIVVLRTLQQQHAVLAANLLPTAIEAAGGFALGTAAALLLATVFVHSRTLREMFFPLVVVFNSIPVVAKAPVLVLIMGNGAAPKVTIAALVCFFPMLVNAVRGLESVPAQQMELMRVLSASPAEVFFRLRLWNALPFFFAGLRISSTACVIGAVVAEWIGTDVGLGALIIQAMYNFDSPLLYSAIVLCAALSGGFFMFIAVVERLVVRW
jgi:NitT/TauT family transport system permease protein